MSSDIIQIVGLVDDGIAVLKDGGLLAGWVYTGQDFDACSDAFSTSLRDRMAALLDHGRGWVLETNVVRLPSTEYPAWGEFPDPVSQVIEMERRRNYTVPGRYFRAQYYMTLTYFPPSAAGERTKGWFYETPEGKGLAEKALEVFRAKLADFESLCSFLNMTRLRESGDEDNLLRYLWLCISGEDRPFLKPDIAFDLDFLFGVDISGGTKPVVNGRYMRALAIDPMPQAIYAGMLRSLEKLPIEFRLHGRALLLDRQEAEDIHQFNRRRHSSKIEPFISKLLKRQGPINERAAILAADANAAASINDTWGHYSARIVLMRDSEQEIERDVAIIKSCAEQSRLKVRVETINVLDSWCGSLPGHAFYDLRQVPLRSCNIAGMSPLHTSFTGFEYCPSPKMPRRSSPLIVGTADGMTPFRHNLHVQDVGHTAVFGPTGNGKSTIFGLHAASLLRYPGAEVVMFDRNRTQYVLCRALGGRFYDFGRDNLQLCPLGHLETSSDLAWAGNYIEMLCRANGLEITSTHTDRIGRTLERFARGHHRSLTHFAGAVGDQEVQAALQFYTIGNPISARLLDGEEDSISDSRFTVFEMAELMQMNRRIATAVQMHLFRRIERKLNPAHITGIFIDEARRMIGDDVFAGAIENWLKEIRNLNGFVMLALQEIEDGQGSKLRSVIEQQCKLKIFLPNAAARAEATREAYIAIGLAPFMIEQIIRGRPKRDYFVCGDTWSRLTFDLEHVALAFLSNSESDRMLVDRLAENGPRWPVDYLRAKGLGEWAEYLEVIYAPSIDAPGDPRLSRACAAD